jgi:hypothetical protein
MAGSLEGVAHVVLQLDDALADVLLRARQLLLLEAELR